MDNSLKQDSNALFPIFVKFENLQVLLIGGGVIAKEKLDSILFNSPKTHIKLVAKEILPEIKELAKFYPNISLIERAFEEADFQNVQVVFAAINDATLAAEIQSMAHKKNLLVNNADKPNYCDFYLGSVVQKGNLKIAISTNGKSPTIAKRLKEILHEIIPEEMDELLENMQKIRNGLHQNFHQKVKTLNKITEILSTKKESIK